VTVQKRLCTIFQQNPVGGQPARGNQSGG
jgi:hypothetical protein